MSIKVGDKVLYTGDVSYDEPEWEERKKTFGIVVLIESNVSVWHGRQNQSYVVSDELLKVVERASYTPVYEFVPGQVWLDKDNLLMFCFVTEMDNTPQFKTSDGDTLGEYIVVNRCAPLTLMFDPRTTT